ncbi:hypothetical protein BGW36DRAFT_70138 [Talaromyces proteolyticus]|uniref:Uncharacterized protein n=1 Tax=Talaromyces proteolyticus TaxID=1131652 RepID=A0AAD4PUE9_9EURO|nr:uncharacterized protein BGW36DRAFT_70138 [Talaromyces proteolyticus]KAH8689327.1 hypothetical protein BGW36DRAFT_70138 [Talaromyces proteolyticus]
MNMDLRGLGLSLLPWTRSLTHAVFLQTSASITLLWPQRLGANAACLCCRTRSAGRAPSGAATRLWSVHLNSTVQTFVLAFTAKSWRLLGAYRFRTMRTPRKVKTTLVLGVLEVWRRFSPDLPQRTHQNRLTHTEYRTLYWVPQSPQSAII